MPDLAGMLLRKSLGSLSSDAADCASCRRVPLAGERLHELETGRVLCDLCLAAMPEESRGEVRSERVRVGERHLTVAPRAA